MPVLKYIFPFIMIAEIILLVTGTISPALFVLVVMLNIFLQLLTDICSPAIILFGGLVQILVGSHFSNQFFQPEIAFKGFASTSIISLGALFLVAKAVKNTGLLESLSRHLLPQQKIPINLSRFLVRLALPLGTISAFFNNTPVVAIFLPTLREWAISHKISPSKVLLPLSYFTIFGGTCTLIGTSTNLVIAGFYQQQFSEQLPFFSFAILGIPSAILGVIYLCTIGHKLLPQQKDQFRSAKSSIKKYLIEMTIEPDAPLIGKSIEALGFHQLDGLFLFEVKRDNHIFTSVNPGLVLEVNDTLVFSGEQNAIFQLQEIKGLSRPNHPQALEIGDDARFIEVVISPSSPLVGRSINDLWFSNRYNATVLALHRNGTNLMSNFSALPLKKGDTLLLLAHIGFRRIWQNATDFLLISSVRRDVFDKKHQGVAAVTLAGMILLPALGILPIVITSLLAVIIFSALKLIKAKSALNGINWEVILTIGAAFGISIAIRESGAATLLVDQLKNSLGNASPQMALITVAVVTSLVSELITNNAAAALIFPVAIELAHKFGVSPIPFIMVLAIAASASFSTPIGYQTNMMVFGPGGYKYNDYLKVGLPLNLIFTLIPALIAPLVWPF